MEYWAKFRGGEYEVSTIGTVRRALPAHGTRVGKHIKSRPDGRGKGYMVLMLRIGGRYMATSVHRIAAEAFLGAPPPGCTDVDHIDGNPRNNHIENLEWVSHAENMRRAGATGAMPRGDAHPRGGTKFSHDQRRQLVELVNGGASLRSAAQSVGISRTRAGQIVKAGS